MPVDSPRQKYKILVSQDLKEIRRVMELLFKHGYVWGESMRYRKFEEVYRIYSGVMHEWEFIRTNFDDDCRMVIGRLNHWEWSSIKREHLTVTVEQFLYDIVGHPRPVVEEKKIVTLEEFNKEFEEFQRRTYPTITIEPSDTPFNQMSEEERTRLIDQLAGIIDEPENEDENPYGREAERLSGLMTRVENEGIVAFTGEQLSEREVNHLVELNNNPPPMYEATVPPAAPEPDPQIDYMNLVTVSNNRRRRRVARRTR